MEGITKQDILAGIENFIDGLRYYLDKGYSIQTCYSNEEEVVVNLQTDYGDEAITTYRVDDYPQDNVGTAYFIDSLSKLAGRIGERHYCKKVCNKPVNAYEKEILRVINNIIKGEADPINKR